MSTPGHRKEARRGRIVVVATHDAAVVAAADRHYLLDDGELTDRVAPVGQLRPGMTG